MGRASSEQRHFAGVNTWLLLTYVQDQLGDEGVRALLAAAGETRSADVLLDDRSWSSYSQFRALLEAAGRLLADRGGIDGIVDATLGPGTSPEIIEAMLAFGSPADMTVATADLGAGVNPALSVWVEPAGATQVRFRTRLVDGFEPFPELCAFIKGTAPQMARYFGLQVHDVVESACQCRGDEECVLDIHWVDIEDPEIQSESLSVRLELAENQLEAFQQTVSDIVSTEDLETVLARIVRGAARTLHAPGFVLSVATLADEARIYTDGVTLEEAEHLLTEHESYLTVEVASTHRRYGRLLVAAPIASLGPQIASLEAYARLAATALDSAFALEQARRQARTAEALLQLSTSLAELTAVGELAAKVARAIPDVIDCDCAAVLLISDGFLRIVAHHGYPPDSHDEVDRFQVPAASLQTDSLLGVLTRSLDDERSDEVVPEGRSLMHSGGIRAVATAPLAIDGTIVGLLVAAVRRDSSRILDDARLEERFAGLAGQATVALRNSELLDQIRHQSLHDALTDLPNRSLILDRAEQMLVRSRRGRSAPAVLFVDLDGFKQVNDTLGHEAGDHLLREVANRFRQVTRASDTVGRLGGDEFVVLVDCTVPDTEPELIAQRLLDSLRAPFRLAGRDRPLSAAASIGIAAGTRPSADELLRDADIALYRAKADGKDCYRTFVPEMQAEVIARAELVERLADAVSNEEFFLVYQPIVDLATEQPTDVEALLRWNRPGHGVVPPDSFIPLLEETGLIVDVGRWVLHAACRQAAELRAAGHPLGMSVNMSVRQLERPEVVDEVRLALLASGVPASSLTVEVTETAIMRDPAAAVSVLDGLKKLGVRVAIDDFGTGYCSLAYLRQFPVDTLKIDRTFVDSVAESGEARELVQTLVSLGRSLRLETLAEGIENRAQLDRLRETGCESGQGYLFAKPLPYEQLLSYCDGARQMAVLSDAG